MATLTLDLHEGLHDGTRLRNLVWAGEQSRGVELAFLVGCGALAAVASLYFDFRLRIPGHAILRTIFPMVLGLALVPRRGAGTVMGASALATGLGLRALLPIGGLSVGALTSMTLTGPLLDLSLRRAHAGWRLYLGCALAGLGANFVAFLIRAGAKLAGVERVGARPFADWILHASFTYLICGLLAGLLSAMIWFQASRPRDQTKEPSA
jgi:hypothetical protein